MILFVTLAITLFLLTLLFFIVWFLVRFIAKSKRKKVRYRPYGIATIVIGSLWTLAVLWGNIFGRFRYEVTTWDYVDERLPQSFDGYRIVHISDFHLEGFESRPDFVDTLVNAVNRQQPDLICFTGDLVSFTHDGLTPYLSKLKRLSARDGVVSILGNHDYAIYQKSLDSLEQEVDRSKLIEMERKDLSWRLLLNENVMLHHGSDSIAIIGLENQACGMHQRVRRGNMPLAMKGTEGQFRILLSHDPSQWDEEVVGKTDIPLTLSGHTHAMQCRLWSLAPSRLFFRRSDGAYREGKQQLYVNIGLGELMPFRIGATPEITVITLRRK